MCLAYTHTRVYNLRKRLVSMLHLQFLQVAGYARIVADMRLKRHTFADKRDMIELVNSAYHSNVKLAK